MEDPKWLRLITIGLVVTALAVGYFLLSGRMVSNKAPSTSIGESATPSASILGRNAQTALSPGASSTSRSTPLSAYDRIASRNQPSQPQTQSQPQSPTQSQSQTLPKTGFSYLLAGIFSIGILISGWGLRKFPH